MRLFLLIAIGLFATQLIAQPAVEKQSDWTSAFPSFQRCERTVQPPTRSSGIVEQMATYGFCGSITLRRESGIRERAMAPPDLTMYSWLPPRTTTDWGYFALQDGPQCGNDSWIGSTSVYFDADKVLIVSVHQGGETLADVLKTVDYQSLRQLMVR